MCKVWQCSSDLANDLVVAVIEHVSCSSLSSLVKVSGTTRCGDFDVMKPGELDGEITNDRFN